MIAIGKNSRAIMPRKAKPKAAKKPPKELVELFSFYARKSKHKNRVPVSELPKMILSLGKSPTAAELRTIVARVGASAARWTCPRSSR